MSIDIHTSDAFEIAPARLRIATSMQREAPPSVALRSHVTNQPVASKAGSNVQSTGAALTTFQAMSSWRIINVVAIVSSLSKS